MEITSMSSRGQIVIPQNVRDTLNLHSGEKFVVVGQKDTILLKKIENSSFDELLQKTRMFVRDKSITPKDVKNSIKNVKK